MTVKRGIVRVALAAVALVGLSVTLAALPADEPSAGAFKWVRSLEPNERAYFLQDAVLRSLPVEHRRALIASIPTSAARAVFWQTAFAVYRDRHALSPDQIAALDRAIGLATSEAMIPSPPSLETRRSLVAGLHEALGPNGVNELLYHSGADSRSVGLPGGERWAHEWRRIKSAIVAAVRAGANRTDCDCAYAGVCAPSEYCKKEGGLCDPLPPPQPDCDPLLILGCEGLCTPIGEPEPARVPAP